MNTLLAAAFLDCILNIQIYRRMLFFTLFFPASVGQQDRALHSEVSVTSILSFILSVAVTRFKQESILRLRVVRVKDGRKIQTDHPSWC